MPAKVFISYSTHDLSIAEKAKRVLLAAGHNAYVADYDAPSGVKLIDELKAKIEEADVFVVLWSQHAKDSAWVQQEIGIAEGKNKIVIPVVLEPGLKVPGFISNRKYVEAHADVEDAITKVRESVNIEGRKKDDVKAWMVFGAAVLVIAYLVGD